MLHTYDNDEFRTDRYFIQNIVFSEKCVLLLILLFSINRFDELELWPHMGQMSEETRQYLLMDASATQKAISAVNDFYKSHTAFPNVIDSTEGYQVQISFAFFIYRCYMNEFLYYFP